MGCLTVSQLPVREGQSTRLGDINLAVSELAARFGMRADAEQYPSRRHHEISLNPAGSKGQYDAALNPLNREGGRPTVDQSHFLPTRRRGAVGLGIPAVVRAPGYPFALVRALRRVRLGLLTDDIDDLGRYATVVTGSDPESWTRGSPGGYGGLRRRRLGPGDRLVLTVSYGRLTHSRESGGCHVRPPRRHSGRPRQVRPG